MLDFSLRPLITLPEDMLKGSRATDEMFGGNILATRGEMTGLGCYDELVEDLGVSGLRYPGGSLTEYNFDITNPNAEEVTCSKTGETSDFIPLSEFMFYASENGHYVTIVIPTRDQLNQIRDENGNREPDIDEAELRIFIHDVATGVYGDADIAGFEIGNEYWGSGDMNAVEYGQLSSQMALIVDDELDIVAGDTGIDTEDISVLVQMGTNFGMSSLSREYAGWDSSDVIDDLSNQHLEANISYENIGASGAVNWTELNNELVLMSFDTPEKIDAVGGVVGHIYTYGEDQPNSGNFVLDAIEHSWLNTEGFENLDVYITEWNMKRPDVLDQTKDYGLFEAHELLDIMEDFMAAGVHRANVWPLLQNTANTLSKGEEYTELTPPGEMFAMMSENLPGKTAIDFTPNGDHNTEYDAGPADIHAFAGDGDVILYIASTSDVTTIMDIDLSNLVSGFEDLEISVLGVALGEEPGNTSSKADIQSRDADIVFEDGILEVDLDQGEIMQVVIRGIEPSDVFAPTFDAIEENIITNIEIMEETQAVEGDVLDDDGSWGDMGILLGLLPLLAFLS